MYLQSQRRATQTPVEQTPVALLPTAKLPATPRPSTRLLIVDGPQSIGTLYASILRPDGHTIRTVSSMAETTSILATYRPDVIIVTPDQFYADQSGFNELSQLRQAGNTAPVLVISAMKKPLLKSNPFVTEYLFLPFKLNGLRERVSRLVDSVSGSIYASTPSLKFSV